LTKRRYFHYCFGHLSWFSRPDIAKNTAEFNILMAFKRDLFDGSGAFGYPVPGDKFLYHNMKEMASRDGLTGLYNYRYFISRLEEEVNRSQRYGNRLSLVIIDIDDFKIYNDKYSHPTGDALLRELARLLEEHVRAVDVVARYGGPRKRGKMKCFYV